MERLTDVHTYYVVFDKSYSGRGWWKPFLNKQFQHVLLYRDMGDHVIQFNPLSHVTVILRHDLTIDDALAHELGRGVTAILSYTVYYGAHYKRPHVEPYTCVTAIKRMLAINSRLMTPKALYHELIKAGAHIIKPYCLT